MTKIFNLISFSILFCVSIATRAADLPTFDVSGKNGAHGAKGNPDYSTSAGTSETGNDGRDGGHAGRATPGQNAGAIRLELTSSQEGFVNITGNLKYPNEQNEGVNLRQIPIGKLDYIWAIAKGGRGGNGGVGGDGEGGNKGTRGRDAHKDIIPAGNGGRGGDGGRGGNGTWGENGGNGGPIEVNVAYASLELLMLIKNEIDAGAGGTAGKNGSGGRGGAGGQGGSGDSWTTYETAYKDVSDGQGGTKQESYQKPVYHTSPGGYSGSSGSSGADGLGKISAGNPGRRGSFKIIVRKEDGSTITADERFDAALESFKFHPRFDDGTMEPDREFFVTDLTIRNVGKLPMPPKASLEIFLEDNKWVNPFGKPLQIPNELAAGASYTFKNTVLSAKIPDIEVTSDEKPFRATGSIRPFSEVKSGINRRFENFDNPQNFTVRFPAEVSEPLYLKSLAEGETTRIEVKIQNTSTKGLGSSEELKRDLQIEFIQLPGDLSANDVVVYNEDHSPVDLNKIFSQQLDKLKPDEIRTVQFYLGFKKGVPNYHAFNFRIRAQISRADQVEKLRVFQVQDASIRVAQAYSRVPNSNLLFGTNHDTTKEQVADWNEVFGDMSLTVSDFNTAYMGDWQLDEASSKQTFTLFTDLLKGVVVILNNPYELPSGDKVHAANLISEKDMFIGASAYNLGFVIWGPNAKAAGFKTTDHLLLTDNPSSDHERVKGFSNIKEYLSYRTRQPLHAWSIKDEDQDNFKENYNPEIPEVNVKKRYWFFSPKEEHLKKIAKKLSRQLKLLFPLSRFYIIYDYETDDQKGIFKNRAIGRIRIQESLPLTTNSLVEVGNTAIKSRATILAIMTAMPFKLKLETFAKLITEREKNKTYAGHLGWKDTIGLMSDALSSHIAREILALNSTPGSAAAGVKANIEKFVDLRRLAEDSDFNYSPESAEGKILIELSSRLYFLCKNSTRWWNHILPIFSGKARYQKAAESLIQNFVHEAMESINLKASPISLVEARAKEIQDEVLSDKSKKSNLDRAKDYLFKTEHRHAISTTAEDTAHGEVIFDHNEFENRVKENNRRAQARINLAKRKAQSRSTLSVKPTECANLIKTLAPVTIHLDTTNPGAQL